LPLPKRDLVSRTFLLGTALTGFRAVQHVCLFWVDTRAATGSAMVLARTEWLVYTPQVD